MNKIFRALFPVVVLVIAVGCKSQQESVFGSSSCKLPCWNGIYVGQTTRDDALEIISGLKIVSHEPGTRTNKWNISGDTIYFTLGDEQSPGNYLATVYLQIYDEKVKKMGFFGDLELNFQDLTNIFGKPETVYLSRSQGDDIFVNFVNPDKGVAFGYKVDNEKDAEIRSGTEITSLILFDPQTYYEIGAQEFLFVSQYNLKSYKWTGFGNIYQNYPP